MLRKLPPQSEKILKALARYHYLTLEQMVDLGISTKAHNLQSHGITHIGPKRDKKTGELKGSRAKFYISNLRHGLTIPGKLPYINYLTPKGINYLYWPCEDGFDEDQDIWLPPQNDSISHDYFHRIAYVSTHIALDQLAQNNDIEIEFSQHYYQGERDQPNLRGRPKTINNLVYDLKEKKTVDPDGIFGLRYGNNPNDPVRIFMVELHKSSDTKKVINQLYRNFKAIPALKAKFPDFPITNNPYVLSVHTDEGILKATKRRICEHAGFEHVQKGLAFALLDNLKQDFASAWHHSDGSKTTIF